MAKRKLKKTNTSMVVGKSELRSLKGVTKNGWNANVMTKRQFQSLCKSLREKGWMASHALLIWGSDENGEVKDLIIDGEHRQRAGLLTGFQRVPMVTLDGITEAEARALNARLDNKGNRDPDKCAALILAMRQDGADDDIATQIGMSDSEFSKLMDPFDETQAPPDSEKPASRLPSQSDGVQMVKLYFTASDHKEFMKRMTKLSKGYVATGQLESESISDTIMQVLRDLQSGQAQP